jgi:hypothetical protein
MILLALSFAEAQHGFSNFRGNTPPDFKISDELLMPIRILLLMKERIHVQI